jgi:endo-1,4-beta-xylanase
MVAFTALAAVPAPVTIGILKSSEATDQPNAPQPILQGGIVLTLYPPDSPWLKKERLHEAEQYNRSKDVPGRINSIVHIHNPSIEVHLVDRSLNTGSAVILVPGGGHRTLNVGTEGADFVPFFYNYGVNTVILRNRLRSDGYDPKTDAVRDAQQAIRLVRSHAKEWRIDPNRIGIMGFSAGAELAAPAALFFDDFDRANRDTGNPLAGISSRPDFVGLVYPGPTPFARGATPPIPHTVPPSFVMSPGSGDQIHALWATEYFTALLKLGAPNLEMHIYGNGHHPGSGSTGGLTDRHGTPLGTWQFRFIDWFRDLGFLQPPGVETKAAQDSAAYARRSPGARSGGSPKRPANAEPARRAWIFHGQGGPSEEAPRANSRPPVDQGEKPATRDRFGDPLPAGAIARLGTVRFRNGMFKPHFLPDGKTILTTNQRAIQFWEAASGRLVREIPTGMPYLWQTTLSLDGKQVAVTGMSGNAPPFQPTLRIWDVATGKEVRTFAEKGRQADDTSLTFTPDGKQLVSIAGGALLCIEDIATGKEVRRRQFSNDLVLPSFALAPNGETVAIAPGANTRKLYLWN